MNGQGGETYMMRAVELAARAAGMTSPNPMVGAVLVRDGAVVGEGYHHRPGEPHAEVLAIRSAGSAAAGADLYVNLEPCCHHGRTPPCTDAIIASGIGRVFASLRDPNPRVAGKGGRLLEDAGIRVTYGLGKEAAERLNEAYLKHARSGLPFVLLKSAVTLDGKIATRSGDSRWITGEKERAVVHRLRYGSDAILTGIGTVLADDPLLTARIHGRAERTPLRVVIDPMLRIPGKARILSREGEGSTLVVGSYHAPQERVREIEGRGARVLIMEGKVIDLAQLMNLLGQEGVTSVMVEGGAEVSASALSSGIVDKVVYFIAPKIVGGRDAPTAVGGDGVALLKDAIVLREVSYTPVGASIMVQGYVANGRE